MGGAITSIGTTWFVKEDRSEHAVLSAGVEGAVTSLITGAITNDLSIVKDFKEGAKEFWKALEFTI
ncbi:MAG: hypothetical protein QNL04_09055 [SAR324 cluster bacterium]|nr:hypothetical protein [SAR324 cluster bacterium]